MTNHLELILLLLAVFHLLVYVWRLAFSRQVFDATALVLPMLFLFPAFMVSGQEISAIHALWILPLAYSCNSILVSAVSYYRFRRSVRAFFERMETLFTKRRYCMKEVESQAFDWLDLDFYEKTTERLAHEGFRFLSDRENATQTEIFPEGRTFIRTLLSNDGTIVASIVHVKTRDRFDNVIDDFRRIQFWSVYSKNYFIATNNFRDTPHLIVDYGLDVKEYPATISVESLLAYHRDRLKERGDSPDIIGGTDYLEYERKYQAIERKDRRHKKFIDESDLQNVFDCEESGRPSELFEIVKKELTLYHEDIDDFVKNGHREISWIPTVVGLTVMSFFFIVGIFCVFGGLRMWWLSSESAGWPCTKGTVTSTNVRKSSTGKKVRFEPEITYLYTVNAVPYVGKRIVYDNVNQKRKEDAEIFLRRFPIGKEVDVYHSPRKPAISVLEPGLSWRYVLTYIFMGLFIMGFSRLFLRCILHELLLRRRQCRRQKRFCDG